jgi:hypothetical protein
MGMPPTNINNSRERFLKHGKEKTVKENQKKYFHKIKNYINKLPTFLKYFGVQPKMATNPEKIPTLEARTELYELDFDKLVKSDDKFFKKMCDHFRRSLLTGQNINETIRNIEQLKISLSEDRENKEEKIEIINDLLDTAFYIKSKPEEKIEIEHTSELEMKREFLSSLKIPTFLELQKIRNELLINKNIEHHKKNLENMRKKLEKYTDFNEIKSRFDKINDLLSIICYMESKAAYV